MFTAVSHKFLFAISPRRSTDVFMVPSIPGCLLDCYSSSTLFPIIFVLLIYVLFTNLLVNGPTTMPALICPWCYCCCCFCCCCCSLLLFVIPVCCCCCLLLLFVIVVCCCCYLLLLLLFVIAASCCC